MIAATLVAAAVSAATSAAMSGAWDCAVTGDVATALIRLQTGEKSVELMKAQDFRYGDFGFAFEGDTVLVRLRVGQERKEQKVPYFRRKNYLTFNYNEGLDETGWASPVTFSTNEAGSDKARYEVSFPTISMRVMTTMSGQEVHLGDAAMAAAVLSCTKKAFQ
jgi:hypothetical protein